MDMGNSPAAGHGSDQDPSPVVDALERSKNSSVRLQPTDTTANMSLGTQRQEHPQGHGEGESTDDPEGQRPGTDEDAESEETSEESEEDQSDDSDDDDIDDDQAASFASSDSVLLSVSAPPVARDLVLRGRNQGPPSRPRLWNWRANDDV